MITHADMLVRELKNVLEKQGGTDFQSEYITVELDEEQYLIDSICHRKTHSDPPMTHLCLKVKRPDAYGCGVIR